ncbi:MAG TPA: hypothetical protein VFJ16_16925 [Longimicrobium sp.]|nr:hypothetical protein [Longimicrobium sp.]
MHTLDIPLIAAVWLGSSIVALPLLAFTARFGLVPLVEAVAEARAAGRAPCPSDAAEARLARMERAMAALAARVDRIAAARGTLPCPAAALAFASTQHDAPRQVPTHAHPATGGHDGHPAH